MAERFRCGKVSEHRKATEARLGLGLPQDFRELLESLNAKGVRYLLVGGYAVGHHGHSRSTNDIDFFISGDDENAKKIVLALEDFGFRSGRVVDDMLKRIA